MKLQTRVYEFSNGKYENLSELAQAIGIAVSQIYIKGKVKVAKRVGIVGYCLVGSSFLLCAISVWMTSWPSMLWPVMALLVLAVILLSWSLWQERKGA